MSEEMPDFEEESPKRFSIEDFLQHNKLPITLLLLGAILIGFGVFIYKDEVFKPSTKIEVLDATTESQNNNNTGDVVVDVSGAIKNPGVYKLAVGSRVEDALIAAGGLSENADVEKMEKLVNRAAKLTDGQKIVIPGKQQFDTVSAKETTGGYDGPDGKNSPEILGETSEQNPININTASTSQLESLWGIGPVTAQNIIEQRPYSNVEELVTKKILKTNVYERNKNLMTVY